MNVKSKKGTKALQLR